MNERNGGALFSENTRLYDGGWTKSLRVKSFQVILTRLGSLGPLAWYLHRTVTHCSDLRAQMASFPAESMGLPMASSRQ